MKGRNIGASSLAVSFLILLLIFSYNYHSALHYLLLCVCLISLPPNFRSARLWSRFGSCHLLYRQLSVLLDLVLDLHSVKALLQRLSPRLINITMSCPTQLKVLTQSHGMDFCQQYTDEIQKVIFGILIIQILKSNLRVHICYYLNIAYDAIQQNGNQ